MASELPSVGGARLLFWQINISGHKARYKSQMVLVNHSSSQSGKSYQVREWPQQMKSARQGYLNGRVWFLHLYYTLKEKVQRMGFMFRKGICRFLFFLWVTNPKRYRRSHSRKNIDDLELLLSMTCFSAITEFSCSHLKLNAAAPPAQTPDACLQHGQK